MSFPNLPGTQEQKNAKMTPLRNIHMTRAYLQGKQWLQQQQKHKEEPSIFYDPTPHINKNNATKSHSNPQVVAPMLPVATSAPPNATSAPPVATSVSPVLQDLITNEQQARPESPFIPLSERKQQLEKSVLMSQKKVLQSSGTSSVPKMEKTRLTAPKSPVVTKRRHDPLGVRPKPTARPQRPKTEATLVPPSPSPPKAQALVKTRLAAPKSPVIAKRRYDPLASRPLALKPTKRASTPMPTPRPMPRSTGTIPKPFQFETEGRSKRYWARLQQREEEERLLEEEGRRKIPKAVVLPPKQSIPRKEVRPLTQPRPFILRTQQRAVRAEIEAQRQREELHRLEQQARQQSSQSQRQRQEAKVKDRGKERDRGKKKNEAKAKEEEKTMDEEANKDEEEEGDEEERRRKQEREEIVSLYKEFAQRRYPTPDPNMDAQTWRRMNDI